MQTKAFYICESNILKQFYTIPISCNLCLIFIIVPSHTVCNGSRVVTIGKLEMILIAAFNVDTESPKKYLRDHHTQKI